MSVGLALLLASACGYGFEVLETTDEEWVAPGYEVVEEAVIDPMEYGEPYTSNGTPTVGVHLSFVETGSGEAWRVVFVLERKIVVLQEGEEPVEIPVELDIASCAFSPSGRYVVVHDGARTYTGENAARIDTQSGEVRLFDSQPDGEPGPRGLLLADDGSITVGFLFFDRSLDVTGNYRSILNPCWQTNSPMGSYFTIGSNHGSRLYLLDKEGDVVWERATETTITTHMAFSPDERLLAIPFETGLEIWDVATGDVVWRDEGARIPGWDLMFSEDGHGLACTVPGVSSAASLHGLVEEGLFSEVIPISVTGSRYSNIKVAAAPSEGQVLVLMARGVPDITRRFSILADGGTVLWASGEYNIPWGPMAGTSFLYWVDTASKNAALSSSGSRTIWIDADLVRVTGLRDQS